MKISKIIFTVLLLCPCFSKAFSYQDDYPPYKFKNSQPNHLEAKLLVDLDTSEYKSKDGKTLARLKATSDTLDFIIQDNDTILARITERETPLPCVVYSVDIDKNGLEDFIVFYWYGGVGLGALSNRVDIFLKKDGQSYQRISYDTMAAGLEDFVDLNRDGRYEVIITGFYGGEKHNYFTYSIYEFNNFRLQNADLRFSGFPKFVWYTDKPNDKDTVHLTLKERQKYVSEKDNSIISESLR